MISFVIPAYNEEALVATTVASLHEAARGVVDYEIVVVDDASSDGTAEIAQAHGACVVHVRNRNIAATRNAGARQARGDLLVFVDADTRVPPETLRATVAAVESGIVAGGCVCAFDEPTPFWVKIVAPPLMWAYRRARLTPGAFVFCTRNAFDAVGGFDESRFGGEEVLIARALDRYSKTLAQRFTIIPERIVTSGRKLRAYSGMELLWTLVRTASCGARSRRGMELWYGPRRQDPRSDSETS